ncbi:hypothetical protein AAMO2058_000601300 [Amorphochlora amoebiformis]
MDEVNIQLSEGAEAEENQKKKRTKGQKQKDVVKKTSTGGKKQKNIAKKLSTEGQKQTMEKKSSMDGQKQKNIATEATTEEVKSVKLLQRMANAKSNLKLALSTTAADYVKLLCVDVEAWEKAHSKITEIGVCLATVSSGLLQSFESRHLIIKEHKHLRNGKWCPDNRDFFRFGKSEILRRHVAANVVSRLLKNCTHVVGHAVEGDLKWLRSLGLEPNRTVFDTQTLAMAIRNQTQTKSLKDLCINIGGFNTFRLHNGGNDAFFTLRLFLRICKVNLKGFEPLQRLIKAAEAAEQTNPEPEKRTKKRPRWRKFSGVQRPSKRPKR